MKCVRENSDYSNRNNRIIDDSNVKHKLHRNKSKFYKIVRILGNGKQYALHHITVLQPYLRFPVLR